MIDSHRGALDRTVVAVDARVPVGHSSPQPVPALRRAARVARGPGRRLRRGSAELLDEAERARAASILDGTPATALEPRPRDPQEPAGRLPGGGARGRIPRPCTPTGKPGLKRDDPGSGLFFNISHSGPLALFAFTRAGEVGIDVELPRARTTDLAGARPACLRGRRGASPAGAPRGTSVNASSCAAGSDHEALLKLSGRRDDRPAPSSWLVELEPGGDAAAAVALGRAPSELCCWEWVPGGARPHDC